MDKTDIKSLDLEELKELLAGMGEKPFRAGQIYTWLHRRFVTSFEEMTDISKNLREALKRDCELTALKKMQMQQSRQDGTRKYLFALKDGNMIESVFMRYKHGDSVCISSQAGCRMGCRFCASTLDGLVRNLTPAEMLDQIYRIQADTGERISNVVVMGTGEPLDNYDNLLKFIRLLTDENGLHISQRNITVSTCGIVPNMRKLASEKLQITLALSLHASSQEKRRALMPVANKYGIQEVIEACRDYFEETGRRITFEYALVGGVNDSQRDAQELAQLIRGLNCHVNLIPVNPIKERDFVQSDAPVIQNFKNKLEKYGINVTIRREMGRDIDGACGQLRKRYTEKGGGKGMRTFSITDKGRIRRMNQDFVFSSEEPVGNLPNLFIVADGMGGHNAGDYASRRAVEVMVREIRESRAVEPPAIFEQAIRSANQELLARAREDVRLEGMGTTAVLASLADRKLWVANVGDSRLYVVNEDMTQVTVDHSLVEELVRMGKIEEAEAREHPDKNLITRAIGASEEVTADVFEVDVKEGDFILLCSDGLTNMLKDEEIQSIVRSQKNVREKVEELVADADANGGKDNITAILIEPY